MTPQTPPTDRRLTAGAFRIDDEPHLRTVLAALASPPVSERERELEGALDLCSAALQRLHTDIEALIADSEGVSGLHHNGDVATWDDLGQGGQFSDWLGDPLWAARNAWHDARRVLTAQPAGEGK